MKILLDEDVPLPLLPLLKHLLHEHQVEHVSSISWRGKKDRQLLPDAARKGFDAILTNDLSQFNDPDECDAIKKSKLHHITYELEDGLDGLALASAAICAGMRGAVKELDHATAQRLVRLHKISHSHKRYTLTDPSVDPPSAYW